MTRKDYELIAYAIGVEMKHHKRERNNVNNSYEYRDMRSAMYNACYDIAERMSVELKRDNDTFDIQRFLLACGFDRVSQNV